MPSARLSIVVLLLVQVGVQAQTSENGCVDFAPEEGGQWHNAIGDSYDCSWYALLGNCQEFGSAYPNFNRTARQACCACLPSAGAVPSSEGSTEWVAPFFVQGNLMVSQALVFTSSGTLEAVAAALQDALAVIHGTSEKSLSVAVATSRVRRLASFWSVEYTIVAAGEVADWHQAIAMRMNIGKTDAARFLAARFAEANLVFDEDSLAVGMPQRIAPTSIRTTSAATTTPSPTGTATERLLPTRTTTSATTTKCLDFVPEGEDFWHDEIGDIYTCEWYELSSCAFADSYQMFGKTASRACCACGGGERAGKEDVMAADLSGGVEDGSDDEEQVLAFLNNEIIFAIAVSATVCVGVCALSIMGYVKVKYFPDPPMDDEEDQLPRPIPAVPVMVDGHSRTTIIDLLEILERGGAGAPDLSPSRRRAPPAVQTVWWDSEGAVRGAGGAASPSRRRASSIEPTVQWQSEGAASVASGGSGGGANRWHSEGNAGRSIPTTDQILPPGGPYYRSENSNARSNGSGAPHSNWYSSENSQRPLALTSRF